MIPLIYADNAATTALDRDAFEAMVPYLLDDYGNASQPYSFSRKAKRALHDAREIIATCIHAGPEEIYFTSGGTESDNWAIKGSFFSNNAPRLITSAIEHHAILHSAQAVEKMGCDVAYLKPTGHGLITPESLQCSIKPGKALVSIMLANNEIGTIQPIEELAEVAHQSSALFHTDAVQAVGHIPVDVQDLKVDMLSASAHKFNGPKGIGFIYIRNGTPVASYMDGGAQEFSLRAGTENVASIVGMAHALDKNVRQMNQNMKHIRALEEQLLALLRESDVNFVKNGGSHTLPGNISLSFPERNGEAMLHRLDLRGISVSTGSACDSQNHVISHVLKAIGLEESYALGTIRISLGKDNTPEEVNRIAQEVVRIVQA